MNRDVPINELVIDQFPAFENDGYTKRSGLSVGSGDFTPQLYFNGALDATPVTIAEIGTLGDYKVSFTPTQAGYYELQVLIDFNKDIWAGGFYSGGENFTGVLTAIALVQAQVDKIDLAPTLGPASVFSGSLMDRIMNKNVQKTYNQGTDSLEAQRDRTG